MLSLIILCTLISYGQSSCNNVYDFGNPSSEKGAVLCADEQEGTYCVGPGRIYYGSEQYGDSWTYQDLNIGQTIDCSNTDFGCDPVPGYPKQCYRACHNNYHNGLPRIKMAAVYCASQLDNNVCTGPGRVYYGDEDKGYQWAYTDLAAGESITCQSENFDGCDPVYGVSKSCYIENGQCHNNENYVYFDNDGTPATDEGAVYCASELDGNVCTGPGRVYFGDETKGIRWGYKDLNIGESIDCQKVNFDGCDPVPNVSKSCYIKPNSDFVLVQFTKIIIMKTLDDGGSVEEWIINDDRSNTIKMNVDFVDYDGINNGKWNGCSYDLNQNIYLEEFNRDTVQFDDCKPSENTQDLTNGFHTCYIPDIIRIIVSKDVFENGLKYSFDFQIGDVDANGFDNGPIFDIQPYIEPDHRSFTDLQNQNGPIDRYFTRWGSEGRGARFFVYYRVLGDNEVDFSQLSTTTCN